MIWVVHPGSGILFFYPSRIPDPGTKKAPEPGSGSATLPEGLLRNASMEFVDPLRCFKEALRVHGSAIIGSGSSIFKIIWIRFSGSELCIPAKRHSLWLSYHIKSHWTVSKGSSHEEKKNKKSVKIGHFWRRFKSELLIKLEVDPDPEPAGPCGTEPVTMVYLEARLIELEMVTLAERTIKSWIWRYFTGGIFWIFVMIFCVYFIQHCFICRHSDSAVS